MEWVWVDQQMHVSIFLVRRVELCCNLWRSRWRAKYWLKRIPRSVILHHLLLMRVWILTVQYSKGPITTCNWNYGIAGVSFFYLDGFSNHVSSSIYNNDTLTLKKKENLLKTWWSRLHDHFMWRFVARAFGNSVKYMWTLFDTRFERSGLCVDCSIFLRFRFWKWMDTLYSWKDSFE